MHLEDGVYCMYICTFLCVHCRNSQYQTSHYRDLKRLAVEAAEIMY